MSFTKAEAKKIRAFRDKVQKTQKEEWREYKVIVKEMDLKVDVSDSLLFDYIFNASGSLPISKTK
jgi:hypothetical protein